MNTIKIYLVDDHTLIVEGLRSMLQGEENISIVGAATNAKKCLEELLCNEVDVLLLDINMGEVNGIELCVSIKKAKPSIKIIGLSTYTQGSYINKMLENGASGYLFKNANKEEIMKAINLVMKDVIYLSQEAEQSYRNFKIQQKSLPILTKRELEIFKLIKEGNTNLDIAKLLFISVDTVDTHRKNLHSKLNVKNTAQLLEKVSLFDEYFH